MLSGIMLKVIVLSVVTPLAELLREAQAQEQMETIGQVLIVTVHLWPVL
jgi:hypothetical protein